jgi:putative methyltransferase
MSKNSSPYHDAGWLLSEHLQKRRGLKSIAFDSQGKHNDKKKAPDKVTYATVCKTMQHLAIINEVLDADNLRKSIGFDSVRNKGLLYVMIYELLFGKYKSIRGGGKIKRMIVKHEKELRREADECIARNGRVDKCINFPRYIRVNTLREILSDAVDKLTDASRKQSGDSVAPFIYVDAHVPDLLVLPPTASSWLHHDCEYVKNGMIVLQDKSSCFAALVLAHGLGEGTKDDNAVRFDYIDACAAPGNKTSHLAALVQRSNGNKGFNTNEPNSILFAFERSSSRFDILQERMKQLIPSPHDDCSKVAVVPIHADFLKADPSDPKFGNVRAILLDPSCSGSGIVNSPDRWMEDGDDNKDAKRIQSLSNFQLVALKHAMSFPQVDRIVYSTCSVHDEENEAVVSKALSEFEKSEDGNDWQLMSPVCLKQWPRRGRVGGIGGLTKSQADCLIRCDGLDGDETNGFFVSFLVRTKVATECTNSRKPIDSAGIPIYNGQYSGFSERTNPIASDSDSKQPAGKDVSKPIQHKKSAGRTQQKNETSPTKANDKSAKKRDKKLQWKRKQSLLKSTRMKTKSENATIAQKQV